MLNSTDRHQLYNWFKTGKKPTEAQFKAWIDSFWHMTDTLPASQITGLQDLLNTLGALIAAKANQQNPAGHLVVYAPNGTIPEGLDGDDGLSAYELAVAEGFVGTVTAWLASLVGVPGTDGAQGTQGIQGIPGTDGAKGDVGASGDVRDLLQIYANEAELPPVADMQEGLLYATIKL